MTARWTQAGPGAGARAREVSVVEVISRACPHPPQSRSPRGVTRRGRPGHALAVRNGTDRAGHMPVDLPEVSRDASISAQTALPASWVTVPQRSERRSTM